MKSKRKVFVEKVINWLLNGLIVIFGIILLTSIYTSVQTKILGSKYPNFFGYSIFEVQTGSMADAINAGDCIIVQLTKKVKLDDIVTYELDGEYITHRIIEVYKGTYVTKGDANNAKDDPIDQKQVIGKVTKILPNFGIIRKTLFNPAVLIALLITLFLFNFAVKKNKKEDNKTENKEGTKPDNKEEKKPSIIDIITKKFELLLDKIKKFINDKIVKKFTKKNKPIEKNILSESDKKDLVSYEKIYSSDKSGKSSEEELDKTSFYRVISVDSNEVDDKFKEMAKKVINEEIVIEKPKVEEDLDKTLFYRLISVDVSELDNTRLEIAENEITATKQEEKSKEKISDLQEEIEVVDDEALTQITLDLLKNKKGNRKSKNIIDNAMIIKEEELNELIGILLEEDKIYSKKATIKASFITSYINAKYYNHFGDNDTEYSGRKSITKMEKNIKEVASELNKDHHSNDSKYKETVSIYAKTFILIANLEHARDILTDSKVRNEFYKKEITEYADEWNNQTVERVISEILKIQKKYISILDFFLRSLETNMFNLNFNKLTTKKDMYGLELVHNITFSKIYSDYIIDKTYTEGIIAEDKMEVLLNLLSVQLIKDMVLSNFNRKYILYIPESLYSKEKKLEKLLRMVDDEYAKENVIILITFEDLLSNLRTIKEVRKMGYKLAIVFDENLTLEGKDRGNIYLADYIFVNKKNDSTAKITSFIPEELQDKVVYEEITDKVGDFGGEQE